MNFFIVWRIQKSPLDRGVQQDRLGQSLRQELSKDFTIHLVFIQQDMFTETIFVMEYILFILNCL